MERYSKPCLHTIVMRAYGYTDIRARARLRQRGSHPNEPLHHSHRDVGVQEDGPVSGCDTSHLAFGLQKVQPVPRDAEIPHTFAWQRVDGEGADLRRRLTGEGPRERRQTTRERRQALHFPRRKLLHLPHAHP